MAVLEGDEKLSFIEQQVLTSRNVKGGWLTGLAVAAECCALYGRMVR